MGTGDWVEIFKFLLNFFEVVFGVFERLVKSERMSELGILIFSIL